MAENGVITKYKGFSREAKRIISAGLIDSLGFGLYGFVLVLYLDVLGHPSWLFGILGLLSEVTQVTVLIGSGYLADKIGRKKVMLIGTIIGTLGILIITVSTAVSMFFLASILIGACGGFWGPAFSALLSEKCEDSRRSYLFSFNSLLGQLGSGTITLIGGFIPLLFTSMFSFGNPMAYRMIFVLALALKIVGVIMVTRLESDLPAMKKAESNKEESKKPWGLMTKFAIPMALTGLGAGMLIPYFQLFFKYKFGTPIDVIGIIIAAHLFVMAGLTIFLPLIAEKRGTVFTTAGFHILSILTLIVMPFTPWLWVVALLFVIRAVTMNVPGPIMSAFMMSQVPQSYRATAQSVNSFAWMSAHAVGYFIGGFLWGAGSTLMLPFYITTVLYVAATVFYIAFFFKMDDKKHEKLLSWPKLPHLQRR
jgi:MFS family permease